MWVSFFTKFTALATNKWHMKLLALLIAIILWISTAGRENEEITVRVPLNLRNIPLDTMVANDVATEIELRLLGSQRQLKLAYTQIPPKVLDLTNLPEGEHFFLLRPEDFHLPSGVEAIRVSPSSVQVDLIPTVTRQVMVRPVLYNKPAAGYIVEDTLFKPITVQVVGAEKDMDNLDWIWTMPIDVNNQNNNFTIRTKLRWPDGQIIKIDPPAVEALIIIKAANQETTGQ